MLISEPVIIIVILMGPKIMKSEVMSVPGSVKLVTAVELTFLEEELLTVPSLSVHTLVCK